MASAILGWSKHASRMVRFNGTNLLSSPPPKLFRDIYGKTYCSEEEKRSSFKVCQDNNAFLTQHNQMYRSCIHCSNCLARVAHNQFPSYCDELLFPPPPEVNCRKCAAEFFRGPKHPVGELTEEMRKKFSKSYEEDCPSATAFHTQHNQICHSCTRCPNCFAHVGHRQLPSYCCKLPLAPPQEGNSKNAMGHPCRVGGRSRKPGTVYRFSLNAIYRVANRNLHK